MTPLTKMFSRPEISGWKPAPSSISAATRPRTSTVPAVGRVIPVTSLSSVLLPEPLRPITPTLDPRRTASDTASTARTTSLGRRSLARLPLSSALLRVEKRRW